MKPTDGALRERRRLRPARFAPIPETRIRAADWTHPVSPLRALGRWSAVTPAVVRPLYRPGQYRRKGLDVTKIDTLTEQDLRRARVATAHPRELPSMTTPSETVEIYRVKCGARTASGNIEAMTMMNGRPATRCGGVEFGVTKFGAGALP